MTCSWLFQSNLWFFLKQVRCPKTDIFTKIVTSFINFYSTKSQSFTDFKNLFFSHNTFSSHLKKFVKINFNDKKEKQANKKQNSFSFNSKFEFCKLLVSLGMNSKMLFSGRNLLSIVGSGLWFLIWSFSLLREIIVEVYVCLAQNFIQNLFNTVA